MADAQKKSVARPFLTLEYTYYMYVLVFENWLVGCFLLLLAVPVYTGRGTRPVGRGRGFLPVDEMDFF